MARASLPVLRLVRGSTFEGAIKTHPFGRWWLTEDSAAYSISLLDFYPRFHAIHSNPWNLDNASDWWLGFKKTRREMWRAYIFSRYTRDVQRGKKHSNGREIKKKKKKGRDFTWRNTRLSVRDICFKPVSSKDRYFRL